MCLASICAHTKRNRCRVCCFRHHTSSNRAISFCMRIRTKCQRCFTCWLAHMPNSNRTTTASCRACKANSWIWSIFCSNAFYSNWLPCIITPIISTRIFSCWCFTIIITQIIATNSNRWLPLSIYLRTNSNTLTIGFTSLTNHNLLPHGVFGCIWIYISYGFRTIPDNYARFTIWRIFSISPQRNGVVCFCLAAIPHRDWVMVWRAGISTPF